MNYIFFVFAAILLLISTEILKRFFSIPTGITRRVTHLGAGGINIMAPLFVSSPAIILANLFFASLLLLGRNTHYFSAVQSVKRRSYGDVFFSLGIAMAAIVFLPENVIAFQFGVAIMGISDALAGLIGEYLGKHLMKFMNNTKSLEGSATFFLSSFVITSMFVPEISPGIILIPLALTAIELGLIYGLDNLILPVAAGLLLNLSLY